ncbi:MAG: hypothetical protein HRT45_08270 [Bdellovibrionales bacterium]|nr:hypothetical protein [Bdellovibrionales bacterium]
MSKTSILLTFAAALIAGGFTFSAHNHELCEGFVPENDMKISTVGIHAETSNVTEADFNDVLDDIEAYYTGVVADLGGSLTVNRLWTNETVNASAQRRGSTYIINMYGGLARHPAITIDGFMLVACHEMGHHLAGAPKVSGWFNTWASNEGQSDYYSSLRCLRWMLEDEDNAQWIEDNGVDAYAMEKCQEVYSTQEEENLCARIAMAGKSVTYLFKDLKDLPEDMNFNTPDPNEVGSTNDRHPDPQCRLDTYFQGALCFHDMDESLSDTDPTQGTCNRSEGAEIGIRPLCWFAPNGGDGGGDEWPFLAEGTVN